jgi:threonine/homoserine/homoserine lactone efflux protein
MHSQLLAFVGAAVLIALTPGADTALVVRNALAAGAPAARCTALGPRAGDVLRRPRVRRALDRATGAVLIGLGVRLALTRR